MTDKTTIAAALFADQVLEYATENKLSRAELHMGIAATIGAYAAYLDQPLDQTIEALRSTAHAVSAQVQANRATRQ